MNRRPSERFDLKDSRVQKQGDKKHAWDHRRSSYCSLVVGVFRISRNSRFHSHCPDCGHHSTSLAFRERKYRKRIKRYPRLNVTNLKSHSRNNRAEIKIGLNSVDNKQTDREASLGLGADPFHPGEEVSLRFPPFGPRMSITAIQSNY
jgi:hypothetical protein